jgi:competence ComEA-like helix-hairpin-helix protein
MKKPQKRLSALLLAMCFSLGMLLPVTGAFAAVKTDINSASVTQLEAVTGVGHNTAQNILDYKKEHGKFTSMDELEAVSGVGKVRLQALNEVFMVESSKKD